jgi:nickel/cobalt transporter (NiCoT) family protein
LQSQFGAFREVGAVVGTSVSALFLLAIAISNAVILVAVYRAFRAVQRGEGLIEEKLDLLLAQRGMFGR